jgi:hypothetical protein
VRTVKGFGRLHRWLVPRQAIPLLCSPLGFQEATERKRPHFSGYRQVTSTLKKCNVVPV